MQKHDCSATVVTLEKVARDCFKLVLAAPAITEFLPGQFFTVLCGELPLRRPLSLADFERGKMTTIFRVQGKGTKILSELCKGDTVQVTAPLGNGFSIGEGADHKCLLIGGGLGAVPLMHLQKELENKNISQTLALGFRSKEDIFSPADFLCTDDGSSGIRGSILTQLDNLLTQIKPTHVYSCGPEIVMQQVAQACVARNIDCEVSLERNMACAIGVCHACVVRVQDENGKAKNATACKKGPVFKGSAVLW